MEIQRKENTGVRSLGYFNLARGLILVMILYGHTYSLMRAAVADSVDVVTMWNTGSGGAFSGAGGVLGGGIMAVMMMISGYSFFKRSPKKCLKIQSRMLIRPYWFLAAAIIATKLLLAVVEQRSFMANGGQYVLTYLLGLNYEGGGTVFGIPVDSINIFWFIWALFIAWNIYNRICQQESARLRTALTTGFVTLGWIMTLGSRVWPYCINIGFLAVGYLAAGRLIREKNLIDASLKAWQWAVIAVISVICLAFGNVNIVCGMWQLGPVDILGSYCIGFILLRLYARVMDHLPEGRIIAVFESVGVTAMWVISLHAYEKVIMPWYRLAYVLPQWAAVIVCFAARCLLIFGLYRLLSKLTRMIKHKRKRHRRNRRNING